MSESLTEEQTLPDECYCDGDDPFMYWGQEDAEYSFCWNGVLGDPIHVMDSLENFVDLIPTTAEDKTTMEWFKTMCELYLAAKNRKSITIESATSGAMVTIQWTDNTTTLTNEPCHDGSAYTKTKPPQSDEEQYQSAYDKLAELFPDEESPR